MIANKSHFRCRSCKKSVPSSRGLSNHYAQTPKCRKSYLAEYDALVLVAHWNHARNPTSHPAPKNPLRLRSPKVVVDPPPEEESVADEDIEMEDAFDGAGPSGWTHDENEDLVPPPGYDEDDEGDPDFVPDDESVDSEWDSDDEGDESTDDDDVDDDVCWRGPPPKVTPTPTCRPPHKSIHEESHPDPTAGGVLRWEDPPKQPKSSYNPIWEDTKLFEHGEWLGNIHVSNREREEYLRKHNTSLPWGRCHDFLEEVDNLPHGPDWEKLVIKQPNGDWVDFWTRNPIDVIRQLMSTRRFAKYMRYAPVRQYTSRSRARRIYGEVWTGNRWWRLQNVLGGGRGATVATVILSSDKTQLSLMSGSRVAWPVYLTIGNISKSIRRRPSEHAQVLLGYIPVVSENGKVGWQFYHKCMKRLLKPLQKAGERGVEMLCADGGVRLVFPILSAFVGDWPEQCLVSCVRQSGCPVCHSPLKGRGNCDRCHRKRDKVEFAEALDGARGRPGPALRKLGYRPVRPFWAKLPFADISGAITPDLLHQVNKGVFLDHLVKWMTNLLTPKTFDRWLTGLPRAPGLRHFSNGKSKISQWTGKEAKSLAQVFMAVASGCDKPDAVAASRHLVDFMRLAHLSQMTEEDLTDLETRLARFHDVKKVFNKRDVLGKGSFDGIPKLHMLRHFADSIRSLGTADNFNTEATERLHIEYVKDGWRASNKVNPMPQMTRYLQRREAWVLLRTHLIDIGILPSADSTSGRPHEAEDTGTDEDGGRFEVVRQPRRGKEKAGLLGRAMALPLAERPNGPAEVRREWDSELIWHPNPMVSTAGEKSHVTRTGAYLARKHHATSIIEATKAFLQSRNGNRTRVPLDKTHNFVVWHRCRLEHGRLPFLPLDGPHTDTIRATPESRDEYDRLTRHGAFDTALFLTNPEKQGIHRYSAGRVRVIFQLPRHLQHIYNKRLVYVEHFQSFSAEPGNADGFYSTSHDMAGPSVRRVSVMPLYRLQMACHLTPRFSSLLQSHAISSSEDLLETCRIFHFNHYSSHFVFNVLRHWDNRLATR